MFFDNQLGQLGAKSDPEPACNCLHGTAVVLHDGRCVCISDVPEPMIKNHQTGKEPTIIYVTQTPTTPGTTAPVEDDTILGIPKWLALLLGIGGGVYFISAMGDKK